MENKLGKVLIFFVLRSGQECYQEVGFFNPNKPNVPAMFKRLSLLYYHKDYMGYIMPTNCLLIDDFPHKGCLNYLNTTIYPSTFNGLEKLDYLNDTLWTYLHNIDGENIMDYVVVNPFGQPQITPKHPDFYRFAPLIKEVGILDYLGFYFLAIFSNAGLYG